MREAVTSLQSTVAKRQVQDLSSRLAALAPIKENIATENNKRPSSSLERFTRSGSFREARNIKTEAADQDNTSSRQIKLGFTVVELEINRYIYGLNGMPKTDI